MASFLLVVLLGTLEGKILQSIYHSNSQEAGGMVAEQHLAAGKGTSMMPPHPPFFFRHNSLYILQS